MSDQEKALHDYFVQLEKIDMPARLQTIEQAANSLLRMSSDPAAPPPFVGPQWLVSSPSRALVCAVKYLYFLSSLGNLSAASPLARDGGACAARPGLVAEKGEPPRTPSIYATDT